jgi:hypothetical protein
VIHLEAAGDPRGVMCIFEKMEEDFGEKVQHGSESPPYAANGR